MTDAADPMPHGPLVGLRVLEFAGIGPGPFVAMMLSDMGAEVVRIDRPGGVKTPAVDIPSRGRVSIELNLKAPVDHARCIDAVRHADVLIEGYRPGVMERLGLGPKQILATNPRLIYGRMTGWGQSGPLARSAGHDINYIALSGALAAIGTAQQPIPPLNLVGDFAGGAMYLAFGLVAALYERDRSGLGQVVDAAVLDGAVSLMALFTGFIADQPGSLRRGESLLSGRVPYYRTYACADGKHVAVGCLEPEFRANMYARLGVPLPPPDQPPDQASADLAAIFATRDRDAWQAYFDESDCCVHPVMELGEAQDHPHVAARSVFQELGGVTQPAPAPRFSRTPGAIQSPASRNGEGGADRIARWAGSKP